MAFDYKAFASEIGMAPEDQAAMDSLFQKYPTAATKIDSVLTAQVEARLSPLQTELTRKQAELDGQLETLVSVRGADSATLDAAEKRAEKLASETAILRSRIQRIATETGLNPEDYLKDLAPGETKVETKVETPQVDMAAVETLMNKKVLIGVGIDLQLEDVAYEHQSLFGTRVPKTELWNGWQKEVQRTQNPNLTIKEFWQQKYDVAKKQEEKREADFQIRLKAEVEKAETKVRDEMALRGVTGEVPTFSGSPALAALTKDNKPRTVGGLSETVQLAIAESRRLRAARAS